MKRELWLLHAELIFYSAGESAGLPDVVLVSAERFSDIFITLHFTSFFHGLRHPLLWSSRRRFPRDDRFRRFAFDAASLVRLSASIGTNRRIQPSRRLQPSAFFRGLLFYVSRVSPRNPRNSFDPDIGTD